MRFFGIENYGETPVFGTRPVPEPGPGEVRLRLMACGLNFADLLMIEGKYQVRPVPPVTLGMEAAGIVEAIGPGTDGPAPGTRVAVYTNGGGLAEFGCFDARRCLPIPDAMSFEVAAGFLIAYGTSHVALDHRARLQPGETLLVLGAAGGVGLTAVEIGRKMGARVIACARGLDKLKIAEAAGAHHLIDSDTADIRAEVKALGGADVVYDPVGGDQFDAALRATRPDGRIIVVGFAGGRVQQIPANHLLVKNITVMGLYWGAYLDFRPKVLTGSLATLLGWYGEGSLRPHVSHVLPFTQAAEGLELLRSRKSTGKIVVTI
ncbi:MAG TPA: NADPH:quinone oxidoreductase family protein [Albidovulum sp.]|uniref:NADPH:quinone oxidoreductase family protein n=1 Tax=Albidovulum sp. TaxID=1872424 RepID=UPI002D04485A|nr:NADPH:quinone oxidoreductase family protein [Albidovulum sp.]